MHESRPKRHGQLVGELLAEVLRSAGPIGLEVEGLDGWTIALSRFRRSALLSDIQASPERDRRGPAGDEEGPSRG